jgi:hypothetical protein
MRKKSVVLTSMEWHKQECEALKVQQQQQQQQKPDLPPASTAVDCMDTSSDGRLLQSLLLLSPSQPFTKGLKTHIACLIWHDAL